MAGCWRGPCGVWRATEVPVRAGRAGEDCRTWERPHGGLAPSLRFPLSWPFRGRHLPRGGLGQEQEGRLGPAGWGKTSENKPGALPAVTGEGGAEWVLEVVVSSRHPPAWCRGAVAPLSLSGVVSGDVQQPPGAAGEGPGAWLAPRPEESRRFLCREQQGQGFGENGVSSRAPFGSELDICGPVWPLPPCEGAEPLLQPRRGRGVWRAGPAAEAGTVGQVEDLGGEGYARMDSPVWQKLSSLSISVKEGGSLGSRADSPGGLGSAASRSRLAPGSAVWGGHTPGLWQRGQGWKAPLWL